MGRPPIGCKRPTRRRAAVEWWASWAEQDQELTYAVLSVLRFDDQGRVLEHGGYDHHVERRERPYASHNLRRDFRRVTAAAGLGDR